MPVEKSKRNCLKNPDTIFFDTGVAIALFNKAENKITEHALIHINSFPHAARLIVTPSLVELFYKLRKTISPKDIRIGLEAYGVFLFPVGADYEKKIYEGYCKSSHTHGYDFADYYLCRAALLTLNSQILTIDRDDFPNAYGAAYKDCDLNKIKNIQIIPI